MIREFSATQSYVTVHRCVNIICISGEFRKGTLRTCDRDRGTRDVRPAKCIRPNENDAITTWPCSCRYPFSNRLTKAPHLPTPCPSFPLCVAVYPTRPLRSVKTMVSCHHRHRRPADTRSLQTCPDRHQAPPLHGHPVKLRLGYRRRRGGEGGL